MAPGKPDRSWHHRVDALVAGGPAAPYHREAPSASHHRAAPSLDFLKSLKSITVADVKADRALRESLRRLRASVLEAHPATGDSEFRATRPPPSPPPSVAFRQAAEVKRAITPKLVSHDPVLRQQLINLRNHVKRCDRRPNAKESTFSILGEIPAWQRVPHAGPRAAGAGQIASIGNGWLGPHRLMPSYRRPRGPANI